MTNTSPKSQTLFDGVLKLILYEAALLSVANVLIAAVMVIVICCLAPQ